MNDYPKMFNVKKKLGLIAIQERLAQLHEPHIAPLTRFVEELRAENPDYLIPYFDPWDAGVDAEVLFLLEAPGRNATEFISRNNNDPSAKNMFEFNEQAGIRRKQSVLWNVVPQGCVTEDGSKNRNPTNEEVAEGMKSLDCLISLLPHLKVIVLVGGKAKRADYLVRRLRPDIKVMHTRHPSLQSLNRRPENRGILLEELRTVKQVLGGAS